jgi:hypothetical protein
MQRKIVNSWRKEEYCFRVPPTILSRLRFVISCKVTCPLKHSGWCVCVCVIRYIVTYALTFKNYVLPVDLIYVSCES